MFIFNVRKRGQEYKLWNEDYHHSKHTWDYILCLKGTPSQAHEGESIKCQTGKYVEAVPALRPSFFQIQLSQCFS